MKLNIKKLKCLLKKNWLYNKLKLCKEEKENFKGEKINFILSQIKTYILRT